MDKTVICVNSHFTGFHLPLESASRIKTNEPYLSLVPTITDDRAPPFVGNSNIQMRNKYLEEDVNRQVAGSKMVESATFTVIYIPEYKDGLGLTYPFLFIILSNLLQWLTYTPNKFQHGQMVGAIMQLNSVVNAQKNYLQSNNLLTQVIYLTYGMVTANILTIALMSFINNSQESGEWPTLVRLKLAIYRMVRKIIVFESYNVLTVATTPNEVSILCVYFLSQLRVLVLSLALLLLPILIVKTDPYTGEQTHYDFIWYIVGFFALFCFAFSAFKEYRKYKKDNAASTNDEPPVAKTDEEELVRMSSLSPGSEWTSEQVGKWIGNSDLVRDAAALTEGELLAIASKFIEANVNGTVFPLVAYDADALKRDVKLTVGEAVLFVHAMEKLSPSEGDQNGPRSQGDTIESGVQAL
jgi:hypothetical protein